MQMPNATPQGIAGLMQKPQGQAPGQQPSPNKASPMAGLGSVDDRVSAYQGNTKPLEQRYAMSQDLLDLLALQKIKSQKDAAARQVQLQMAQQGAQDGQANMTVAQQREQEVKELTKNELAQQRGDTAQKQTGDQQAMMQKMMGGIAGAPGANAAAQPVAMAAGGIVGYAGPEGSQVQDPVQSAKERAAQALAKLRTYGLRQRQQDPEGYKAAEEESRQAQEAVAAAERAITGGPAGVMRRPMGAPVPAAPAVLPVPPALSPEDRAMRQAPVVAPAAPVAAAPAAAGPVAPKPPGIAGLPGAAAAPSQVQPGVVGPANDFGKKLEAAALRNAELDPAARQLSEEERITNKMALTPDQRKVYDEGIAGLQGMYKEQYDPERLRSEGLKRALIGAGGRRYGEFAGAATAGMNYDDQMRAAKLKEFGDVQKARTGLIDIDRANVKEGIGAGQKTYEQTSMSQRQGLESGRGLYGEDVKSRDTKYITDVKSRDDALNREIDRLKIAAQNAATAATREGLSQERARTVYSATLGKVQELERRLDDDFATRNGMLLMAEQSGKMDAAQKNQLETARIQHQQQKAKIRKEMEPVLESARQKLGMSSSDGFGEMKKVEPKK
jgi:hypothetical protein